jgi:hypothetical protein
MAKMKTYLVEVEVTRKVMLFVHARKPGSAAERIQSEAGWLDATRFEEDVPFPRHFDPETMEIVDVRDMGD